MGKLASHRKADSYRNQSLGLVLGGIVLLLVGFYVHIILVLLSFTLFIFAGIVWNKQKTWNIGAQGEVSVIRVLRNLDPSFKKIHDVFLPGNGGNIDHVVVGPTGVFVIETKNHSGIIRCNGDYWARKKVGRRGKTYSAMIGKPPSQARKVRYNLSYDVSWFVGEYF